MKGWTDADVAKAQGSPKSFAPRPAQTPPALSVSPEVSEPTGERKQAFRRTTAKIAEDERDASLRPRFAYSDNPLLSGIKFVAYGLTEEQALALRGAALQSGIQEQS